MEFEQVMFHQFMVQFSNMLIVHPYHTDTQLASIASHFWEKMAQHFKDESKRVPHEGEKKRGFWLFALSLEKALLTCDKHFFHQLWRSIPLQYKDIRACGHLGLMRKTCKRV
uniref:Uncharacterized protein n=1 Tax=Romanomermis culicivorax TaxID=13658 RepID=A0A915KFW0_ROMCU